MLRDHVAALRSLDDCGTLFRELGYRPARIALEDGWTVVARWNRLRVLAAVADAPHEAARTMARELSGTARAALVAAFRPGAELVVAAPRLGQRGSSRLLRVSIPHASAFALDQLEALRPRPGHNALTHALHIVDVLANEELGERFFVSFRAVHHRMSAAGSPDTDADDRSLAALLALTRVLFLYFVQAKGWLDGSPHYLRDLLDTSLARRRHFHRDVLEPLFFGALNRPARDRAAGVPPGRIPYLNGGLFEPHAIERRAGRIGFANHLWRDAFDDVFERYRFCVREDDETGTIAPDMLGRVFERVMDSRERHATGTYYTPESVVRDVVHATIATALTGSHLTAEVAQRVVRGEAVAPADRGAARRSLGRLTVLDPAVGSGAFLLGALECLTEARLALRVRRGARDMWRLRRRILRENLFGVDVSPVAVRLAELRLWLAIVADDPTDDPDRVEPLPNLDGIVRQGDSLLDPVGAVRALGIRTGRPTAAVAVEAARAELFDARADARRGAERALRTAEEGLARDAVRLAARYTRAALRDLATLARGRDLFGRRTGLTEPQRRRHRALKQRLAQLRDAARRVDLGEIPFFSYEIHRPDVTARGGFDVVVGNPPWVRAERIPDQRRHALKERFSWWRSAPSRGFGHLPDLSVAFLERAYELAAPDGALGMLVPSKIASAGYGGPARSALVREATIAYLRRIPDETAAHFRAVTYPLAVVVKKQLPRSNHRVALDFERSDRTILQKDLASYGPWVLLPERAQHALRTFTESGTPLSTMARPALGVKTGADGLFLGTVVRRTGAASVIETAEGSIEIETNLLRPVLRGRDVAPFAARPTRVIVWSHDRAGEPCRALPRRARAYFSAHKDQLAARADYAGGPVWTIYRVRTARAGWRVAWPDIARRPAAVVLSANDPTVPLNTCYVAGTADEESALVISAVINSSWSCALVRAVADEARGGYRRNNAAVMGRLPIPTVPRRRRALTTFAATAQRTGDVDQNALDRHVARALDLPQSVRVELAALARDSR